MGNPEQLAKIIKRAELRAEIKVMQEGYKQMSKQIEVIKSAQAELLERIYKKMDDAQEVAEDLSEIEYQSLKAQDLN